MQDKKQKYRKWMWISFLVPLFIMVLSNILTKLLGIALLSGDCFTVQEFGGYCKALKYLGTDSIQKIAIFGIILLPVGLLSGIVLFFMGRQSNKKRD